MKLKPCKCCGNPFPREKPMQIVCGPLCAAKYGREQRIKNALKKQQRDAKEERKQLAEMKIAVKTLAQWIKEAQAEFNRYIRERDYFLPCVSCGRHHKGQYHAGHYLSTGARPDLRFDEENCHKQCSPCNNYLSGNIVNYRPNLILKIGIKAVDRLEGPNTMRRYTIDEVKLIKAKYRAMANELKKAREAA